MKPKIDMDSIPLKYLMDYHIIYNDFSIKSMIYEIIKYFNDIDVDALDIKDIKKYVRIKDDNLIDTSINYLIKNSIIEKKDKEILKLIGDFKWEICH